MRHMPSIPMLVLAAALVSLDQASGQSIVDPTRLPLANRQQPAWAAYAAPPLDVLNKPAYFRYQDPVTGVWVSKMTSATVPEANTSMFNDYSEGGPFISREWGPHEHTILVHTQSGFAYLVDYQRGSGEVPQSWWKFPTAQPYPGELHASFSNVETTPQVLFFVSGDTLYRFNTSTKMLHGDGGHIPVGGRQMLQAVGGTLGWMQSDKNDEWFVFQVCYQEGGSCVVKKVIAYNRLTDEERWRSCLDTDGARKIFNCGDLDEPHLDRDGKYVVLLDGTKDAALCDPGEVWPNCGVIPDLPPTCGGGAPDRNFDEYSWHLWDLSVPDNPPAAVPCKLGIYTGHPAWARGYFVSADPSPQEHPNFYYNPREIPGNGLDDDGNGRVDDEHPTTAEYADPLITPGRYAFLSSHQAGQWIQPAADLTQWYWGDNYTDGEAGISDGITANVFCPSLNGWVPYSGQIYKRQICWDPRYKKPDIGIRAVYQTEFNPTTGAGDPRRMTRNLTQVFSLGAVVAGTFFHEIHPNHDDDVLYVWAFDDGDPTGRVSFFAPTTLHRAVGVRRLDGTDERLLCHNYSWGLLLDPNDGKLKDDYNDQPQATTSPDGKLVMFHSNMGKWDGREDVFVAEVPVYTVNTLVELPNSDAGPNQGSPNPGGPHYAVVDDDPNDGDTSSIQFALGGLEERFTIADQLVDSDTVTSVKVRWVARDGSGTREAEAGVVVGSQPYYGPSKWLPTSYTVFEDSFATNPATGQPWTVQDVRSLKLIYHQITGDLILPRARLTELVLVVTVKRWS